MQKALLIGNGPSATSLKLGKEIDEFDGTVVRFNTYRIEGFEEYVGTRTDVWIACDVFPRWHKDYQKVICCSYHRTQDNKILVHLRKRYPDCNHFPEWAWQETMNGIGHQAPSSGAVATTYFAKDHEVYIYGFDFFSGKKHHYGDELSYCYHQGRQEMEYFRKLITEGKAVPFHNYLGGLNYTMLHSLYPSYGVGGNWFKHRITELAKEYGVKTILDYGCGKGSLVQLLNADFKVYGYDPYVEEFAEVPVDQVDMVVSTDFFEHVDKIDEVMEDISAFKPRVQFHTISNRKAAQILPDGNNAHCTVKPAGWWGQKLAAMGTVTQLGHDDRQNFTMYKVVRS
jgi:hypothetical protein